MYPSDRDSNKKKEWDDCVVSIDDKGRDLKRKFKHQRKINDTDILAPVQILINLTHDHL